MALITPEQRFRKEREECLKAWKLLRKIPEYIADYKKTSRTPLAYADKQKNIAIGVSPKASSKNKDLAKKLEKVWGFFPLSNPDEDLPNFEFITYFSSYSKKVDRFNQTVDFRGLDLFKRRKDGKLVNPSGVIQKECGPLDQIEIRINVTAPINVILKEIKEGIGYIQETFGIDSKNTKCHDAMDFVTYILKNIGLTEAEIRTRLSYNDKKAGQDFEFNDYDKQRKRIARRYPLPLRP